MGVVELDDAAVLRLALVEVEAEGRVAGSHQHVGAVALLFGDLELVVAAVVLVEDDLGVVAVVEAVLRQR